LAGIPKDFAQTEPYLFSAIKSKYLSVVLFPYITAKPLIIPTLVTILPKCILRVSLFDTAPSTAGNSLYPSNDFAVLMGVLAATLFA
jgi:hypothetical protein